MANDKQTLGFQTEVKQLLHLMINSLYSNREIFLRELISNANDACDKVRFGALENPEWIPEGSELAVRISIDPNTKELVIEDNGIGMTREDVISNLGTIARSGTAEFLKNLTGSQKTDANLIGQFGVGFYSSFIVATKVTVKSRHASSSSDEGTEWISTGDGDYTVQTISKKTCGTTIRLKLKSDASEFSENYRIRHLVTKYADHVSIPVYLKKPDIEEKTTKTEEIESDWEQVNQGTALWTRSRSEVSEDEYNEFYKHIAHDFEVPLSHSHHKVEGKLDYTGLLYIPSRAQFDLYNRESPRGLKLYVQRVFIMDRAEEFLPLYLRFIRGVVDSSDLSLNVSRELLQKDTRVESMKQAVTRRALDMISRLAKDDEKFSKFWASFGDVLKEGPAEDPTNKERITKILRFGSTKQADCLKQMTSVDSYIEKMIEGQKDIYYLCSDSSANALGSPYLETFKSREIEVLLMSGRIDEWLMSHLDSYKDHKFVNIGRDGLELPGEEKKDKNQSTKQEATEHKDLLERVKNVLGSKVSDVKLSIRLTTSAAVLVLNENEMGPQMRQIMSAAGQSLPDESPILEINPEHAMISALNKESDDSKFSDLSHLIFDHAKLASDGKLEDAPAYLSRVNSFLMSAFKDE